MACGPTIDASRAAARSSCGESAVTGALEVGDAAMAVRLRAPVDHRSLLDGIYGGPEHAVHGAEAFARGRGCEQPLTIRDAEVDERRHAEGEKRRIVRKLGNRILVVGDRPRSPHDALEALA